jgi:hypothetical protein
MKRAKRCQRVNTPVLTACVSLSLSFRSFIVSRDATLHEGKSYILDFIKVPTFLPTRADWSNFYSRVEWDAALPIPASFFKLELKAGSAIVYRPCPPFKLELEECGEWLTWTYLTPEVGDDIKALCVKAGSDPKDPKLKLGIATHLDYPLWVSQLEAAATPPPAPPQTPNASKPPSYPLSKKELDNFTDLVSTRVVRAVESKLRNELSRSHGRADSPPRGRGGYGDSTPPSRRRSTRSRSPPPSSRSSVSPASFGRSTYQQQQQQQPPMLPQPRPHQQLQQQQPFYTMQQTYGIGTMPLPLMQQQQQQQQQLPPPQQQPSMLLPLHQQQQQQLPPPCATLPPQQQQQYPQGPNQAPFLQQQQQPVAQQQQQQPQHQFGTA